jgi:hypothetical protein
MVRHWAETKHRRDSNGHGYEESYTSHKSQSDELGDFIDKTPFAMKAEGDLIENGFQPGDSKNVFIV